MKDLIILGNGMAGMTAALYARRANLDFKIVGRDEFDFGQIGNAILVENFPCAESQSGFDLAMKLHDQLVANDIKIEEHTIKLVRKVNNIFIINYEDSSMDEARAVIQALGARHRTLNFEAKGSVIIHHCALCDGPVYKNRTVAVIGGGDVAFTQAEYLSKICKQVIILMCDRNVTAAPSTFKRVNELENVKIVYDFPVTYISNSNGGYFLGSEGIRGFYSVDGIFVAIGMIPNTQEKIMHSQISTNTFGYITADENCKTTCDGFFVAGDVRAKAVRQALTAAADGANAVNSVINYLKMVK